MDLTHFRMLINELINKDPDLFLKQAHLIILNSKSSVCMTNIGKDTKHSRHIDRIMHFVRNGEECNFHKTVWCYGGLQLV